jgi:hypothetical protein
VAENRRAPSSDKVDVFPTIDVGNAASLGLVNEKRLSSDTAKSPDRRVYTPDEAPLSALPEFRRDGAWEKRGHGIKIWKSGNQEQKE